MRAYTNRISQYFPLFTALVACALSLVPGSAAHAENYFEIGFMGAGQVVQIHYFCELAEGSGYTNIQVVHEFPDGSKEAIAEDQHVLEGTNMVQLAEKGVHELRMEVQSWSGPYYVGRYTITNPTFEIWGNLDEEAVIDLEGETEPAVVGYKSGEFYHTGPNMGWYTWFSMSKGAKLTVKNASIEQAHWNWQYLSNITMEADAELVVENSIWNGARFRCEEEEQGGTISMKDTTLTYTWREGRHIVLCTNMLETTFDHCILERIDGTYYFQPELFDVKKVSILNCPVMYGLSFYGVDELTIDQSYIPQAIMGYEPFYYVQDAPDIAITNPVKKLTVTKSTLETGRILAEQYSFAGSHASVSVYHSPSTAGSFNNCVCSLGIGAVPSLSNNPAPKISFPNISGCWVQGIGSGMKANDATQLMDFFGTTYLSLNGNYWGGFNGPSFEDRTGWLGGFGTSVPYFRKYASEYPNKEPWEARPPEDRYSWDQTFSYFHPPAKTNHWYPGVNAGGMIVQGSKVTSAPRNDEDVLFAYDIRPKDVAEIRGVTFKLRDVDKGVWYTPEKQLSFIKADYGDPDQYKRRPNDRTLNFIIPAQPGRTNMRYQLWSDISGLQFYKPYPTITTNFFPLDSTPSTLFYRGKYKDKLRIAVAPIALNYYGLYTNRVSAGAVSEMKKQLVNDMVCMLPIKEDEITFVDWVDSDKDPYFTLKCKSTSVYWIKQIVSTKMAYYLKKHNLFSWAANDIDVVIAVMPKKSLGGDGAVMGLRGSICMVEEGSEEAALHEVGHAMGLYNLVEQYNYPEWPLKDKYDGQGNFIDPQCGAPIHGVTAFIAEKGRSHTFKDARNRIQHYPAFSSTMAIRKKRSDFYAWDVMGTVKPKWMVPTTFSSFCGALDTMLGGTEDAGSTRSSRAPVSNGYVRILLSSPLDQDDTGRPIVDRSTLQCEVTPPGVDSYVADHYPGIYSNNHVGFIMAANALGEPVLGEFDYPEYSYRGKYQTTLYDTFMQTYDVPTSAVEYIFYNYKIYDDEGDRNPMVERRFTKADSLSVSLSASSSTFTTNVTLTKTVQAPAGEGMPVELTSRLYYSTNNGAAWSQWGHWETDDPLTVFTDFLPVDHQIAFMLEVNDGFQTVSNVVNNLTKLNQAPQASIALPLAGSQAVTGTAWQLSAQVFDPDGGEVTNVVWTSSIDGELGRDATLRDVVLSEGSHALIFVATDSQGAAVSTNCSVQVVENSSGIDLFLTPDALVINNGVSDPVEQPRTGLLRGATNRLLFTLSNQGITNAADFSVWYTPDGGAESGIITTQINWAPLETTVQMVDVPVSTALRHAIRARITPTGLTETVTGNNEHIWTFTNHPPEVFPLQVYAHRNNTNRWLFNGWDADGDLLTYELVDAPRQGAVYVTGEAFAFLVDDFFGSATFTYRASDGVTWSEPATVTVEVPAPIVTGIAASDSTSTNAIEVSWTAVSGATAYDVFRNTATNPIIHGSVKMGRVTTNRFSDTAAQQGNTYYYSVRPICGEAAGELAQGDFGYLSIVPPPFNLRTYAPSSGESISVMFSTSIFMRYGYIYRSTSNDFSTKEYIGKTSISTEFYSDKNVVPGYTYYYWVQISDGDYNYSPFAGPVTGVVAGSITPPPAAPTGVQASYGTYSDYVKVTWNPVAGADSYVIMRYVTNAPAPSPLGSSVIGTTNATTFYDTTANPDADYAYRNYWVAAAKDGLYSAAGGPSVGYRSAIGPATNATASQKQYINQVVLSWSPASFPRGYSRRYEIWRSPDTNIANAVLIDTIYQTSYTNDIKGYGSYYYFIRPITGDEYTWGWRTDGYGPFSDPIPGQPYYDPDNQEFADLIINADPFDNIATYADVRDGDDFDGDGQSNIEERHANTDPVDADSLFAMDMLREQGAIILSWPAAPGRTYRVEAATNLCEAYLTLSTATNSTIPYGYFTNRMSEADSLRFFRLQLDY